MHLSTGEDDEDFPPVLPGIPISVDAYGDDYGGRWDALQS